MPAYLFNFILFAAIILAISLALLLVNYFPLLENYNASKQDVQELLDANEKQKEKLFEMDLLLKTFEERIQYIELIETKLQELSSTTHGSDELLSLSKSKESLPYSVYKTNTLKRQTFLLSEASANTVTLSAVSANIRKLAGQTSQGIAKASINGQDLAKSRVNLSAYSHQLSTYPDFAPTSGVLTEYMGYRTTPREGFHGGIDIANAKGTPIYASAAGIVSLSGTNGDYGLCVIIDHGNGYTTVYAHNSELIVSQGDRVIKGQLIALMGSTGYSTGNHCHFEVRKDAERLNPLDFVVIVE